MKVFKYQFSIEDEFTLELPLLSEVLTVQLQHGIATIWALVNDKERLVERKFWLVGTGQEVHLGLNKYIGTFQMLGGNLVYHLFEKL